MLILIVTNEAPASESLPGGAGRWPDDVFRRVASILMALATGTWRLDVVRGGFQQWPPDVLGDYCERYLQLRRSGLRSSADGLSGGFIARKLRYLEF